MPKYKDFDLDLQNMKVLSVNCASTANDLPSWNDVRDCPSLIKPNSCGGSGGYTERQPNDGPPVRC